LKDNFEVDNKYDVEMDSALYKVDEEENESALSNTYPKKVLT
jgi:hypothetical protein